MCPDNCTCGRCDAIASATNDDTDPISSDLRDLMSDWKDVIIDISIANGASEGVVVIGGTCGSAGGGGVGIEGEAFGEKVRACWLGGISSSNPDQGEILSGPNTSPVGGVGD